MDIAYLLLLAVLAFATYGFLRVCAALSEPHK